MKQKLLEDDRAMKALEDQTETTSEQSLEVYRAKNQLPDPETLPRFDTSTAVVPSAVLGQQRMAWQPNIQEIVEARVL